jgi:survival-of-motor-neuron-related-splicing factor 30
MTSHAQDLETFQAQLEQVEQVLKSDPENAELISLSGELRLLIALTEKAIAGNSEPTASSSSSAAAASTSKDGQTTANGATKRKEPAKAAGQGPTWSVGDECLAKYSGDDKWYPARITFIGGSEDNRVYSVIFKGYQNTELIGPSAIKKLPPGSQAAASLPSAGTKRKVSKEEDLERERKKKRNEKKLETRAQKAAEQDSKKATWQKFANKSVKKGVGIAGVSGTSIFKTPDNPHGKGTYPVLPSIAALRTLFGINGCYTPVLTLCPLSSWGYWQWKRDDRSSTGKETQIRARGR